MHLFYRRSYFLWFIFYIAGCLFPVLSWASSNLSATEIKVITAKAEKGELQAQSELAERYYKGDGVKQDFAKAALWYKKLAESEVAQAQLTLALMYIQGSGMAQNNQEAIKWLTLAAEQRLPEAQYLLGLAYAEGHGVSKDLVKAYMWYEISSSLEYDYAIEARAALAKILSAEEITAAEAMATKWWMKFHH